MMQRPESDTKTEAGWHQAGHQTAQCTISVNAPGAAQKTLLSPVQLNSKY